MQRVELVVLEVKPVARDGGTAVHWCHWDGVLVLSVFPLWGGSSGRGLGHNMGEN